MKLSICNNVDLAKPENELLHAIILTLYRECLRNGKHAILTLEQITERINNREEMPNTNGQAVADTIKQFTAAFNTLNEKGLDTMRIQDAVKFGLYVAVLNDIENLAFKQNY